MLDDNQVEDNKLKIWHLFSEHHGIKIDDKFVLKLTKGNKNVTKEVKDSCKVLYFSLEWNFEDVLVTIDRLDPKEYPQAFIFIIEVSNLKTSKFISKIFSWFNFQEAKHENIRKLTDNCIRFCTDRPIVLQLTLNENVTTIYHREQNSSQVNEVNQQEDELENSDAFTSFLRSFLDGKFSNSEIDVLNYVREFQNRSLILRFLRTLNLSDEFFGGIILDVATEGSKSEFLAALDSPLDSNGRVLSIRSQKYISDVFGDDDPENDDSVLLRAIENENMEVIDYLITYWSHLIQQLPFDHQIKISTTAFETNQLDVLCDLLDIADFPFPDNFKQELIEHERLRKITTERNVFKAAIEAEDFEKIDKFIDNNSNLKFIHNSSNNSALTEAINLRKFGVFYYLKSLNFKGEKCDDILAKLTKEEKEQAVKLATDRRKENVTKSEDVAPKSVMLLSMRSSVHNSRTEKIQASKYREKIMSLFIDIHKVAPELIDVAASCNNLKIIFDFESDSVESMSLTGSNAAGSMYSSSKWIFVGAKLSDRNGNLTKQREQKIKGVLAHELCHYVMRLVYDNQENPYYKDRDYMKEMFEEIVKIIDKWSSEDSECPDDECNGIISSVFKLYLSKDFHPELIVRIVQILSEFDDNEPQSEHLQHKYETLFHFWKDQVIPELQNYLLRSKEVIKLNRFSRLLRKISEHQIEIKPGKDINKLINNKLVIVSTNHPKLLLIDICRNLRETFGNLMDSKNFFTELKKLVNPEIWDELKQICLEHHELSIFVDCTKGTFELLGDIFTNKKLCYNFLVSSNSKFDELNNYCIAKGMKDPLNMEINYNWSDLTEKSQLMLLQTKINFQNNSEILLNDLLKNKNATGIETNELIQIIDDQILKLLIENHKILINAELENNLNKEKFIFQSRRFRKKQKNDSNQANVIRISQDELLLEIKNQKYVMISDQAGNGKSWAMKNLTRLLREHNPTSWVTYVDLKQFIDEFKACKGEPEFSSFLAEKILKLQQEFEVKIFQKLYKNGKVFILFDGFDEIAPNYAEFVSKLAQNFKQNGGNQLWIATRDYFEVDLLNKLKLDAAYGLDEMIEEEGVDLITRSWILKDLEMNKNEPNSKEEFDEVSKMSPNYEGYQKRARQIIKKAAVAKFHSVGLPQVFKMISDEFKNVENVKDLQGSKIYVKFIKNLYKRWSEQKGPIRNEASIDSQEFEMTFYKFHQYQAILSLFPKLAKVFFPDYDGSEWSKEEIIACALMTIIDGKIFFLHKTFCEFFVADFIAKNLKKPKIQDQVIEMFVEVLTVDKFEVIRMFLNDMLDDNSILQRIKTQMQIHVEKFNEMTSFTDFFTRNLTNLVDFVLEILKSGNNVRVISKQNIKLIAVNTSDSAIFKKFLDFTFDVLKGFDFVYLIPNQGIFQRIIGSSLEIEVFDDFVTKMENKKIPMDQIRWGLMMVIKEWHEGNIFSFLFKSSNLNTHKVNKFIEIMKKFLTVNEILDLMCTCTYLEQNILQDCVDLERQNDLKKLWTVTENIFAIQKFPISFKEFIKERDKCDENILYSTARCNKIEVHETVWELLLKTFKDRDELKDFILEIDYEGDNFVHRLVKRRFLDINELTFKIFKENFSDDQFQEILKSNGQDGTNAVTLLESKTRQRLPGKRNLLMERDMEENYEYFQYGIRPKKAFTRSQQRKWSSVEYDNLLKEIDMEKNNKYHRYGNMSTIDSFTRRQQRERLSVEDDNRRSFSYANFQDDKSANERSRRPKNPRYSRDVSK